MALKLKKKIGTKSNKSDYTSKFQKKSKDVLERTYKERAKESPKSTGKTIYNQDRLDEYGIRILPVDTKKEGEYYINFLPQSYDKDVPSHEEISVHYQCGIKNDAFICMEKYSSGKEDCERCKTQAEGWRKYGNKDEKVKSELVQMYPQDKCVYLLENLGPKYLKDEDSDGILYIKDFPKKGFHAKVIEETRDKKTGKMIDIADVEEDGRLCYFKVSIKDAKDKGKYPEYGAVDLMDRDQPIDNRVMETLTRLIEDAAEEDMTAIQFLLHFPDQDEVKKSVATEIHCWDNDSEDDDAPKTKGEKKKQSKKKEEEEEELDLDELEETLNNMKTGFQIKRFCKENDLEDVIDKDMDRDEMIEAILTHFAEQQE